jgi:hypothetical protein
MTLPEDARYFLGLDLGQASDFTALCVVAKVPRPGLRPHYAVRELIRFPLGTPYTEIVPKVVDMTLNLSKECPTVLVLDATGVGRPVVDMFRERIKCAAITITAGSTDSYDEVNDVHRIPKKDLVGFLQVLLQDQRLKVAKSLPLADVLAKELLNFKVKITAAGNETFESWREKDHDDLVLALALACWVGLRCVPEEE